MTLFFLSAVGLSALVAVLLLWPLRRQAPVASVDESQRHQTNRQAYRERVADLGRDLASGAIDAAVHQRMLDELGRALLDDETGAGSGRADTRGRGALLVLIALLPAVALGMWMWRGAADDLALRDALQALQTSPNPSAEQVRDFVAQMDRRLERSPEPTPELRTMRADFAMEMRDYPAAERQYRALARQFPEDAQAAGLYAQGLYLAAGRKLTPEARAEAERALALDPRQPTVLGLLGIHSFETGDYKQAAQYWQRLLTAMPADSPNRALIESGLAEARRRGGEPAAVADATAAASGPRLAVTVKLAGPLPPLGPEARLLVFARAVNGPQVPLAVARLPVADWPVEVTLDDSLAMAPGMNLSSAEQVVVTARVSQGGGVPVTPGDLEGRSAAVAPGDSLQAVTVQLDRVLN